MSSLIVMNIDDDQDDRVLFCDAILEIDPRIQCITKSNAEEALMYLREASKLPSLIFLDVNMPSMDGKECLHELKKNEKLASIPVVVLSTTRNPKEIREFKKLGADFLHKESNYQRYVESIRSKVVKPAP
jgi:CheY-like chemotaxis protein